MPKNGPMNRKAASSMWRGVPLLLSMPLTSRRLPPRLSGYKRKDFNYAMFVIHSWRHLHTRQRMPRVALQAEAFAEYIGSIDDLLDKMGSPSPKNVRYYQSEEGMRKLMSRFVRGIKGENLSTNQKKEIFKIAADFRRAAWKTLQRYEHEMPTLENVLRMKEETSGEYGRVIAAILNVGNEIPLEKRANVEKAFADATMALQVYDDLFDIRVDRAEGTPNIVISVLQEHPAEYAKALGVRRATPFWLRRYCPRSYRQIEVLIDEYLSRLPVGNAREKAFQALPRVLWYIAQLRRG